MNFIRCGDISRFQFSILKVLTLREFLVFRQLWLYTNPERNCSDRKTGEERLTLFPRLQLFVTFCSAEPLYCALRLPSEISPAQSPRSFDVSSLFTYRLDVRFLEVSRALFFDTGPPYIYHLGYLVSLCRSCIWRFSSLFKPCTGTGQEKVTQKIHAQRHPPAASSLSFLSRPAVEQAHCND